jgi:hypothetical protein
MCCLLRIHFTHAAEEAPRKTFAFHTNHAAAILVDKSRFQGCYDDRFRGREVARGDIDATVRRYIQHMRS